MNPVIRQLERNDINQVYDLGRRVKEFSVDEDEDHSFWPKEILEKFAEQGLSFVVDDKNIVGFLLSVYQPITGKLTWENMYLEPEYRKKGLADECFEKSWSLAKERGAKIAEGLIAVNNVPSLKMLERLGFHSAGNYCWMLKFE